MNGNISNFDQVASLRRYTLTEGRGKNLDILDCDNGKIRFLLNVSKALDVMQLYHQGQNMSFLSKNAFEAQNLPFLNRFEGGMVYTCGLDSLGDRPGYAMHGTLHQSTAQITRAECNEDGIVVEALIRDSALFGKNLLLKRRVSSAIGGDSVRLEDTLINEGYRDEEYCLLYHINLGYPMLDEGAKIVADGIVSKPRNEWACQHASTQLIYGPAIPNMEETCYFLQMKTPEISLENEKICKRFTVSYSGDTLPHFTQWKSLASGDYALGFEPCTAELDDGFAYRIIKPQEKIQFWVDLSIHSLS